VDQNLAVHGAPNVYVASSSTFVTSGQANSTFMIVAFAVRLADHLRWALRTPALDHIREPGVPISLTEGGATADAKTGVG
jgi:choline dehydrogenase-like flavoprotein